VFHIEKVYFEHRSKSIDREKEKKIGMFGIRKTNILGFFNTGTKKIGKNQFQLLLLLLLFIIYFLGKGEKMPMM
jgi:hypothetical protein